MAKTLHRTLRKEMCAAESMVRWRNVVEGQNGSTGQSGIFIDWAHTSESTLNVAWISSTCAVLVDDGSDTTAAYLHALVLALASHPHYQQRAWQELDEDITRVPFVKELINEILRLQPPFKMALPHATTDDIEVISTKQVQRICSSGTPTSMVISSPEAQPWFSTPGDGYRLSGQLHVRGREGRICPGQYSVRRLINLVTMHLIWAFEFGEARNTQNNKHIPPSLGKKELLSWLRPFTCDIKPRHPEIIRERFAVASGELEKYEIDLWKGDAGNGKEVRERLL
ncbi:cytochrome P450 [Mycena galopus ATCC 62051]|nr:cytochrome P450 [Mycena galopus ATCC 62051]